MSQRQLAFFVPEYQLVTLQYHLPIFLSLNERTVIVKSTTHCGKDHVLSIMNLKPLIEHHTPGGFYDQRAEKVTFPTLRDRSHYI